MSITFEERTKIFYDDAYTLLVLKNHDYATGEDPFLNFRASQHVGVDPKRGILVRMMDKMSRVGNLLDKPAAVNESLSDTLLDIANYANLLNALLHEEEDRRSLNPAESSNNIA